MDYNINDDGGYKSKEDVYKINDEGKVNDDSKEHESASFRTLSICDKEDRNTNMKVVENEGKLDINANVDHDHLQNMFTNQLKVENRLDDDTDVSTSLFSLTYWLTHSVFQVARSFHEILLYEINRWLRRNLKGQEDAVKVLRDGSEVRVEFSSVTAAAAVAKSKEIEIFEEVMSFLQVPLAPVAVIRDNYINQVMLGVVETSLSKMSDESRPGPVRLREGNIAANWSAFEQRFDIYMKSNPKRFEAPANKWAIMMNEAGKEAIEVYNSFKTLDEAGNIVKTDNNENFDEVVKKFRSYTAARKSVLSIRTAFRARKQKPGETFANW
ncbi:Neutral ceramidase [Frankliniella fusca]|uniref:Neutral ceramidase n=1 Tax=Frankliniella fusca TaxID=407009 RepID=A0AAE1I731_9NEOP|nr:Neutral ceramidase [Frankliniella fusca]